MINLRPYIAFTMNGYKTSMLIQGQFNFPYDEILHKCFRNDSQSSIGSIEKIDVTLHEINRVIHGDKYVHLIIGYDQDPVIECYKEKCRIVDSGPDEIHSVPPREIYGPNWNKRNPDKEWLSIEETKELLYEWKTVLATYSDSMCVPRSAIKEEYLKGFL